MEVKLKENQFKILSQIQVEKQALQNEFNKIAQKEQEIVSVIAESANISVTAGMKVELKDGALIFSEAEPKTKKLKKSE